MHGTLAIALRYLAEIVGGFFAGAAFAMSLVVGIALFVGHAVMKPTMHGSDLERILDFVAGPAAVVFALVGMGLGIVRVRRQLAPGHPAPTQADHAAAATQVIGGFALAVVVAIAVGALAWPWLIITMTDRGIDTGALIGATAIPLAVGLVVFVVWRTLRARRPPVANAAAGPRAALRRTPPALVALAFGSSALLAAGTLAAVSNWHELLFVLFGLPLALTMFFAHLFSCIWFFRPMPPRA